MPFGWRYSRGLLLKASHSENGRRADNKYKSDLA